jgi:hypothetical protein
MGMILQPLFDHSIPSARVRKLVLCIFAGLLIVAIFLGGIQLRRWVGENTRHVRYQHDVVNALYWGNETLKEARRLSPDEATANSWAGFLRGYFALYDHVKNNAYEKDYHLDYPPLRLLLMAIWAKQVHNRFPGLDAGHPKLVNPLLKINIVCELLSAVAIFFLVRLCLRNPVAPDERFPTQRSRFHLRSCRSDCGMAGTVDDSRLTRLASMGRANPAVLSFRRARSLEKSLVRVWLFAGCRLDV